MQHVSVAMSLMTLSLTGATYLFFQHDEYLSYDKRLKRRTPGLNNPKLISTAACTVLYLMVNAPRVFANAIVISSSPILAMLMMVIESLTVENNLSKFLFQFG